MLFWFVLCFVDVKDIVPITRDVRQHNDASWPPPTHTIPTPWINTVSQSFHSTLPYRCWWLGTEWWWVLEGSWCTPSTQETWPAGNTQHLTVGKKERPKRWARERERWIVHKSDGEGATENAMSIKNRRKAHDIDVSHRKHKMPRLAGKLLSQPLTHSASYRAYLGRSQAWSPLEVRIRPRPVRYTYCAVTDASAPRRSKTQDHACQTLYIHEGDDIMCAISAIFLYALLSAHYDSLYNSK